MCQKLGVYGSNPAYLGVTPIPQDDGPHPLAQIAYSDHYSEAMSYLRALMLGEGEMSERALKLTGDIIAMNPAHYTVWYCLWAGESLISQGISSEGIICIELQSC